MTTTLRRASPAVVEVAAQFLRVEHVAVDRQDVAVGEMTMPVP